MIKLSTPQGALTLEGGQWTADNTDLAARLNATNLIPLLPAGYIPYQEYALAQIAADLLGGVITHADEPDYDPNLIY
jgi:hypothetical protein